MTTPETGERWLARFPLGHEATVTVVTVGKSRVLVELPNGAQTWVERLQLRKRVSV